MHPKNYTYYLTTYHPGAHWTIRVYSGKGLGGREGGEMELRP